MENLFDDPWQLIGEGNKPAEPKQRDPAWIEGFGPRIEYAPEVPSESLIREVMDMVSERAHAALTKPAPPKSLDRNDLQKLFEDYKFSRDVLVKGADSNAEAIGKLTSHFIGKLDGHEVTRKWAVDVMKDVNARVTPNRYHGPVMLLSDQHSTQYSVQVLIDLNFNLFDTSRVTTSAAGVRNLVSMIQVLNGGLITPPVWDNISLGYRDMIKPAIARHGVKVDLLIRPMTTPPPTHPAIKPLIA